MELYRHTPYPFCVFVAWTGKSLLFMYQLTLEAEEKAVAFSLKTLPWHSFAWRRCGNGRNSMFPGGGSHPTPMEFKSKQL
jgi:hypothetical protein